VPDPRNDLVGCGVPEIEALDKSEDAWGVRHTPCIPVSPFGSVSEEGGVSKRGHGLLMPLPSVPKEVLDESV
jgi:hypothetical protein